MMKTKASLTNNDETNILLLCKVFQGTFVEALHCPFVQRHGAYAAIEFRHCLGPIEAVSLRVAATVREGMPKGQFYQAKESS